MMVVVMALALHGRRGLHGRWFLRGRLAAGRLGGGRLLAGCLLCGQGVLQLLVGIG
jgi:hypothetical protein